ncbi:hypothetical protein KM043_003272 [Ampulex compressa]|nr:hypothetical protein KM043_003272 [Ampulex compressa]
MESAREFIIARRRGSRPGREEINFQFSSAGLCGPNARTTGLSFDRRSDRCPHNGSHDTYNKTAHAPLSARGDVESRISEEASAQGLSLERLFQESNSLCANRGASTPESATWPSEEEEEEEEAAGGAWPVSL